MHLVCRRGRSKKPGALSSVASHGDDRPASKSGNAKKSLSGRCSIAGFALHRSRWFWLGYSYGYSDRLKTVFSLSC